MPYITAHACPLRSIAGEQEGDWKIAAERLPRLNVARGLPSGEVLGVMPNFFGGIATHDHPMLQMIAQMRAGTDEFAGNALVGRPVPFIGRRQRAQRIAGM